MTVSMGLNPAELAAQKALDQVYECIRMRKSFVFEAGAGAGKTYSLEKSLRHIIKTEGIELLRRNQQIACITYTNVAKNELRSRTDGHPVVLAETIHSFCWSLLKDFQPKLRELLPSVSNWAKRIEEQGELGKKPVNYSLGFPRIEEHQILLHHDDVIGLMVKFMEEPKFRAIFYKRYPILFIDEYQDTDKGFAESLKRFFDDDSEGPLIGLFGDHWQTIYEKNTCGKFEHPKLVRIDKNANFRSEKAIVESLNRMRVDLPQNVSDPTSAGEVTVFHTNDWLGKRQTGQHWKGDLPPEVAHQYMEEVQSLLTREGWDFSPANTKTLMLTHKVLAEEQGYRNIADVFSKYKYQADSYAKKQNEYIEYFVETLEPICSTYEQRKFGQMFSILDGRTPNIRRHEDKVEWSKDMDELLSIRLNGSVGDVIEMLKKSRRPRLSQKIESKERRYMELNSVSSAERTESDLKFIGLLEDLKAVSYREVMALAKFIEDKTPFATKHSVKGAQFENVLVVVGRGWNQYNFDDMLAWENDGIPSGKKTAYERNRNLFYVACSRPKKRLALLFTQKLSDSAIVTLQRWFGADAIQSLPHRV